MLIDPEIWQRAEDNTEFHRSQVQGFLYGGDREDGIRRHVIRDCTLSGNQRVWEASGTDDEYDVLHARMLRKIRSVKTKIIISEYTRLLAPTVFTTPDAKGGE